MADRLIVKGAREHNLRSVDLGKLAWRMMKENRELYPMADAEIRRADSTFA